MSEFELSRRGLLKAGGAALLTAGALGTVGAGTASAAVPASPRFDLSKPSADGFRKVMLHEAHHAMQGIAFDNRNRELYIVLARDGGSGDDLCITRLSTTGEVTGAMHVNNAGHGVSIGVEPVGSDTYIWMESDSDHNDGSGRGTALQRFRFVSGASPASVQKYFVGSDTITCATDPINQRILIRRNESDGMTYRLYNLADRDPATGTFTNRLAKITQPRLGDGSVTFQGYTVFGQYLYTLDGTGQSSASNINSYLTCIDLNTGKVVERSLTKAGESLVYREPEGMAVYRNTDGETRLYFGFASRTSIGDIDRYANLFHKNVLI